MSRPMSSSTQARPPDFLARAGALTVSAILILSACSGAASTPGAATSGPTTAPVTAAPPTTAATAGTATTAPTTEGTVAPTTAGTVAPTTGGTGGSVDTSTLVVALDSIGTGEWAPARTGDTNAVVSKFLFDTLTRLDHTTKQYVPDIAASWTLSPDNQTWDFKLNPNIPFQGGYGTVTASDVKYTWGQWISADSNHELGQGLTQAVDGNMDNFKIISPLEFTVHTTHPVVTLPSMLSDFGNGLQVVPEKYYQQGGAAALTTPIGTGPWKFVSETPGDQIVMDAVKDHFRQPPAFDRLIIKEIPDSAARLAQVESGAVDLSLMDASLLGEAQAAGLHLQVIPDVGNVFVILGGSYWGSPALDKTSPWIQADHPEKGLAIREAMSLAIDRQTILTKLAGGNGQLETGPVIQQTTDPRTTDPSWSVPAYDPAMAKQKLAEGGYPNGFPITLFEYPDYVDLPGFAEAIAGMWEAIGLQVTRMPGDQDILNAKLDANPPQTNGWAWVKVAGVKADISTQLQGYRQASPNDHKFFWPAIDTGYPQMLNEPDVAKRYAIAKDIIKQLADNYVALSLFNVDLPFVAGPKVGSWDPVPGLDEVSGFETVKPPQ